MIELLGIGYPAAGTRWLFRQVSTRLEPGALVFVISADREARIAIFDTLRARRVPYEGRAWVSGVPVTTETTQAVRARVGDVNLHGALVERGSVVANVVIRGIGAPARIAGAMRLASTAWRVRARRALAGVGLGRHAHRRVDTLDAFERRRVLVARALVTWPQNLVVPEIDDGLGRCDAADVLGVLRTLTRCERMTVLVSATDPVLVQMFADRILRIADAHVGAPRSQVENT